MNRAWVLCTLVTCAIAVPVLAGDTDPARGASAVAAKDKPDNPNKGPGNNSGKGNKDDSDAPAPAAPATPAAPAAPAAPATPAPADDSGKDKGKSEDKGKGPKNTPTTTTPASPAAPAAPAAPVAAPGASATPVVAFDTPATAPAIGRSVGVAAADGTVYVRTADGRALHALDAAAAIPTGARVDARGGTVELTSVVGADGTAQTATFTGAIFEVHQDAATGLTRLRLRGGDFSGCRVNVKRATTAAAKKRKPIRSLWGKDDNGRFQTSGKGAVGTVRGTRWLTQDFCDGTLTTVAEGSVAVKDLRTGKTHVVRAGHSYFARY